MILSYPNKAVFDKTCLQISELHVLSITIMWGVYYYVLWNKNKG